MESFIEHSSIEIKNYLQQFGVNAVCLDYNAIKFKQINNEEVLYYKNEPLLELPKVVFARGNCYKLMHYLKNKGVVIINGFLNMVYMKDKWQTYLELKKININQPRTINSNSVIPFKNVVKELGVPFIVKYRFGSQGKSVFKIETEEEYKNIISKYNFDDLILQEYISTSFGKDIRIFVVGNKYFGAVRDNTQNNDFRANLAQGGISYKFEIDNDFKEEITKICNYFKTEIVGLDFLFGKNGEYVFCEANGNAGFKSFTNQGINMNKIIAEHIYQKYFKEN